MRTVELLSAVQAGIKSRLTGLKTCALHPGRFDAAALKRYATATPAVLIACLGNAREPMPTRGERSVPKRLAAYLLTTDTRNLPRDEAGWNLADALTEYLPGQTFGRADRPRNLEVVNLWSGDVAQKGVFLLAVTWEQTLPQGAELFQDADFLPERLYLGEAPRIGIPHEAEYEELTGV